MKMSWMLFVICCNFALVTSVSEPAKTCPASCLSRMNNIKKRLQKQINKNVIKKINELEDDIALLKSESNRDICNQSENTGLKSNIKQLKTEIMELKSDNDQLKTQNKNFKSNISQLKQVIGNLKDTLNNLSGGNKGTGFSDSVILRGEPKFQEKLTSWVGEGKTWKLCWQATKDGWGSKIFHSKCDYKVPTLIIVKVGRYIFGGYATASWDGNYVPKQAPGSFIFSLRNKENLSPFKAPLKSQNDAYGIFADPRFGPYIGGGSDLYIAGDAGSNNLSYANFGISYQPPSGVRNPKTVLAGTEKFTPSEVEVFYLS